MEQEGDFEALEGNVGPVIDINQRDEDDSTPLCLALKNKSSECAKYLLKSHSDKLDVQIKSKRHGNQINLAIKSQDFEVIDLILSHKMITAEDSHVLNFIIPNFERNPKDNSKIMVKLIMDKGVDPN